MSRKTLEWSTVKYGTGTIKRLIMMVFISMNSTSFHDVCFSWVTKKILIESKIKLAHIPRTHINFTTAEIN